MNQIASNQQDRIGLNKTIYESEMGRNLVEAAERLLDGQAGFFDDVARFEIISARRISTSYRIQFPEHKGELWEVWEFELFAHPDSL
jgi:hypothetical protein